MFGFLMVALFLIIFIAVDLSENGRLHKAIIRFFTDKDTPEECPKCRSSPCSCKEAR